MKKMNFYKVMMMAVVALCSISLTSCGGDDDDDLTPPSVQTGDVTPSNTSFEYVVPCLTQGATRDQVKTYMAGSSWTLETNAAYLKYMNAPGTCEVEYTFFDDSGEVEGLIKARVKYKKYTEEYWLYLIQETQKRYNVTLTIDNRDANTGGAEGTATIDGKQVDISMMKYAGEMYVSFLLRG